MATEERFIGSERDLQRLEERSFQDAYNLLMGKEGDFIAFSLVTEILGISSVSVRWLINHGFLVKIVNPRGAAQSYVTPRSVFNLIKSVIKEDDRLKDIPEHIRLSMLKEQDRLVRMVRYILAQKGT